MEVKGISFFPNITLDFFHLEAENKNTRDIFVNNFIPSLNNTTVGLVTFDNDNVNMNGISSQALGFTFSVYKEANNSNKLDHITRITNGQLSLLDYNVANQTDYTYYIFKEDDTVSSAANISNTLKTCWWNWSITGITKIDDSESQGEIYYVTPEDVWTFNLNVESAEVVRNFNKTEYKTLTKFPKISTGKLNYATGSLTCLLGEITNDRYVEKAEKLNAWNEFCNNGQLKLLKDRKGHKFIVDITSSSTKTMDETREQADTLTFSWIQLNESDDMTIIGNI